MIAGQRAVAAGAPHHIDQPAAPALMAIRQGGQQCELLAEEGVERQHVVAGQGQYIPTVKVGQQFITGPTLYMKLV